MAADPWPCCNSLAVANVFDSLSQIRMALRRGWLFLRWKVKPQGREEVTKGGHQAALQEEEGDFLGFA